MSKFKIGVWWSIEDFSGTPTEAIETAIKHLTDDGWTLEWFIKGNRNDLETLGKWSRIGIRLNNGEITLFDNDFEYDFQPNDKSSWSVFNKQQYECPYAVIEELQVHVETLEEALEKVTKELLQLRGKQNVSTETSFKPIADMTMEDWILAERNYWVFEQRDGTLVEVDCVDKYDETRYPVSTKYAWLTLKGYEYLDSSESDYDIIKRIK